MAARVAAALSLLLLLTLVQLAAAHNPCCARVTPFHIQALAQRVAQRFQALEFRAQDLRGVFAAFQAVHGNATNRLRLLEAEFAHLSQVVSRLDSRVQALEAERGLHQHYKRGDRTQEVPQRLTDWPDGLPFMTGWRRRRREGEGALPHLFVHLDQTKDSEDVELNIINGSPTPSRAVEAMEATAAVTQVARATSDSATTPTPLWQLEETASALLDVMSAGDDGGGGVGAAVEGTSYWAPANESHSLEELFGSQPQHDAPQPSIAGSSDPPPSDLSHPTISSTAETPVSDTANETLASNSSGLPEGRVSNCSVQNRTDGEGGGGCGEAELSDAELQEALGELEALLQRPPPPSAPPPDPEKVLLKRALRLALGALDRTSDACLNLVNFTTDALEGLAAAEAEASA